MIKIEQLLPLLKKGWVAMDKNDKWWWYKGEPVALADQWFLSDGELECFELEIFNIAPSVEDWTKSLMRCGDE